MLFPPAKPATQLPSGFPAKGFTMQLMLAGALVMVPEPVPVAFTLSSWNPAGKVNVAVRVMSEFIVT